MKDKIGVKCEYIYVFNSNYVVEINLKIPLSFIFILDLIK